MPPTQQCCTLISSFQSRAGKSAVGFQKPVPPLSDVTEIKFIVLINMFIYGVVLNENRSNNHTLRTFVMKYYAGQHIKHDVRGSVHHTTILTVKNPTRCNGVSKFYYSLF